MDKSFFIMCRGARTLNEMKMSELDEPTTCKLRRLIYEDEIETNHQEEENKEYEEENDGDDVVVNHEAGDNDNARIRFFGVNSEFIKKLKCGEIRVESLTLPPLGQAIDGIAFPKIPPIKILEGQIGNCSAPFEKQLTTTDLNDAQGRLVFCKMAVDKLLKPMFKTGENLKKGINVTVYDKKGKRYAMTFKIWSEKLNVLAMGWKLFHSENELKECEDWVTVWMFRRNRTEDLCFAIIPRRFPISKLIDKGQKKGSKSVVQK